MIGAQPKAKKKVDEPKYSTTTLASSPTSSPVPPTSPALLLPRNLHVQVEDLGDGGSSDSESTESDEVAKKTVEIEKGQESSKLVSQAQKNPFSLTAKVITSVKRKIFLCNSYLDKPR